MTFLRALGSLLSRRPDADLAQDIIVAGNATRHQSGRDLIASGPHSSQGVRPYGIGY